MAKLQRKYSVMAGESAVQLTQQGKPELNSLFKSHLVHYQLIRFTNEEVLVMMAAACWGSLMPVAYKPANDDLFTKFIVAFSAVAISSGLQVGAHMALKKYEEVEKVDAASKGHEEQALEFLIGILVWQPRVSWAMLGAQISNTVQAGIGDAIGSPAAGILASFVLAYLLFIVGGKVNYAARHQGDRLWVYPLQTLAMSNLQMCAKICYVSWLGLSAKISSMAGEDETSAKVKAAHSFWTLWFLFAITYSMHSKLKANVDAAAAAGRAEEAWHLQKEQWFICFIFASGFPDTCQTISVDWLGGEVWNNMMAGVYFLYFLSILSLLLCYFVAMRVYLKGREVDLAIQAGEASGLHWKDGGESHVVHLLSVKKGSPAFKQGLSKFEGHRVLSINGSPCGSASDAHELEKDNTITVGDRVQVTILFKSYQTVCDALEEEIGPTAGTFLSNCMNNMFWWAIGEQVMELWAVDYLEPGSGDKMGGLWCFILASILTALCVVVFHFNNARWEAFLASHGGKSASKKPQFAHQYAEKKKQAEKQGLKEKLLTGAPQDEKFVFHDDKSAAGPQQPVIESLSKAHAKYHGEVEDPSHHWDRLCQVEERLLHCKALSGKLSEKLKKSPEDDLWEQRLQAVMPNLMAQAPSAPAERKQWYKDVSRWASATADKQ